MKHLYAFLIFAALVLTAPAALANINQFSGSWKNVDSDTGGLTSLQIDVKGERVKLQAWGRCHPSDCAWGYAEGTAYGPGVGVNLAQTAQAISTIYITSFSQTILIIHPADNGQIQVEALTKFTDQSGRSNTRFVFTLKRVKSRESRLVPIL